jgi:hypothetical protein
MPSKSRQNQKRPTRARPPGQVTLTEAPTVYANLCNIAATPEEVIFSFGQRDPESLEQGKGIVVVYTSLAHAKRIAGALTEAIARYESLFGEIPADPAARLSPETLAQLIKMGQANEEK